MKKTLFALVLTIANFTAPSQTIIPFVGGNLSGYSENHWSSRPVAGLNAGLLVDIRLVSRFSVQSGFQYMLTGGKRLYYDPPVSDELYRIQALQVPLMLVFKTGKEGGRRFFAGAGIYVTRHLAGTLESNSTSIDIHGHITTWHEKQRLVFSERSCFQPIDYGLNVGAGYQLSNGLELYASYQKGSVGIVTDYFDERSPSYQFSLSVRYALKLRKQKTGPQQAGR